VTETASGEGMQVQPLGWQVTVPAGTYFPGGPGCTIDDRAQWLELLDCCGSFEDRPAGTVGAAGGGQQVLAFRTRYGDGIFRDQDGTARVVDSGLAGLVPEAVFSAQRQCPGLGELGGQAVTFGQPMTCRDDRSGLLVFGADPVPEKAWACDGTGRAA
jgi:hypothetical protein